MSYSLIVFQYRDMRLDILDFGYGTILTWHRAKCCLVLLQYKYWGIWSKILRYFVHENKLVVIFHRQYKILHSLNQKTCYIGIYIVIEIFNYLLLRFWPALIARRTSSQLLLLLN